MSQLEDLLRDTLRAHEDEAPNGAGLLLAVDARSTRRPHRLPTTAGALATAATVAAVALLVTVLPSKDSDSLAPYASPARTTTDAPAGMQWVSFHGVQLAVPDEWKINDVRCGTPQSDTVVIENGGGTLACLAPRPPGLTVVRLTPLSSETGQQRATLAAEPLTIDGYPATRGTGTLPDSTLEMSVLSLPDPGVVVSVEGSDQTTADTILSSVRPVAVDANGCRSRIASLKPPVPADAAPSQPLVPAPPVAGVVCRYGGGWLERSAALTTADLERLTNILTALPPGVSKPGPGFFQDPAACEDDAERGFLIQLDYADRASDGVYVHIGGCRDLSATNGRTTRKISAPLVSFLLDAVGYDAGFPNPHELR